MCIYQSELYKVCFQLDMVYGDFNDMARKTASERVLIQNLSDIKEDFLH